MVTDQVFRPMSWVLQIVTIVRKDAKTKEYNIPSFNVSVGVFILIDSIFPYGTCLDSRPKMSKFYALLVRSYRNNLRVVGVKGYFHHYIVH